MAEQDLILDFSVEVQPGTGNHGRQEGIESPSVQAHWHFTGATPPCWYGHWVQLHPIVDSDESNHCHPSSIKTSHGLLHQSSKVCLSTGPPSHRIDPQAPIS